MINKITHPIALSIIISACGSQPLEKPSIKDNSSTNNADSTNKRVSSKDTRNKTVLNNMDEFTAQLNDIDIENQASFDDSAIGILSVNPIMDDSEIAQEINTFKDGCTGIYDSMIGNQASSSSELNKIMVDQGSSAKDQFVAKCQGMFDTQEVLDLILSGKPAVFMGAAVGFKVGDDAMIKTVFSGMDVLATANSLLETTGSCSFFNRPSGQGLGECLLGRIQTATQAGTIANFDFELPIEDSPLLNLIPANVGVGSVGAIVKAASGQGAGIGAAGGVVGVLCSLGKGTAFAAGGAAGAVYSALTSGQVGATGWAGAAEFTCPQGI